MWSYSSCAKLHQKHNVPNVSFIGIKEWCTALAVGDSNPSLLPADSVQRRGVRPLLARAVWSAQSTGDDRKLWRGYLGNLEDGGQT